MAGGAAGECRSPGSAAGGGAGEVSRLARRGVRTRRLAAFLARRRRTPPARRAALDASHTRQLGQDVARSGEALLTPAAAAALDASTARRLVPLRSVTCGGRTLAVQRLRLERA